MKYWIILLFTLSIGISQDEGYIDSTMVSNPKIAWKLSLIPGLGQLYNGKYLKALGFVEGEYIALSRFNKYKKVPKLNKNVIPIIGWVQDTLPDFLTKNKRRGVNFVYLDLDTYPSTKFVLEKIKPYLNDKCIIVFDQLYNYPGWRIGEYKALIETFSENEFKYLCFAKEAMGAVVIEFNNKSNLN